MFCLQQKEAGQEHGGRAAVTAVVVVEEGRGADEAQAPASGELVSALVD